MQNKRGLFTISRYCPSEPLIEKFVQQIYEKGDLFSYTHEVNK